MPPPKPALFNKKHIFAIGASSQICYAQTSIKKKHTNKLYNLLYSKSVNNRHYLKIPDKQCLKVLDFLCKSKVSHNSSRLDTRPLWPLLNRQLLENQIRLKFILICVSESENMFLYNYEK